MARILTFPASAPPAPTIEPPQGTERELNDYQRIQAPAAAFGAASALGLQEFGSGVLKASDFYDQASAEQAFTNYQHDLTNLMSGDPNDPSQPGFLGMHGEDAMKARPQVQQQLETLLEKYRGTLSTGRAQLDFLRNSRRFQSITLEQMGRHYEQQSNVWGLSVATGSMAANERSISTTYNDPNFFSEILEKQRNAATIAAQHQGHDQVAARAEGDSRLAKAAVEGPLALNDYANAKANFDRYAPMMDPNTRLALGNALRGRAGIAAGHAMLQEAMGTAAPRGEAAPPGVAPMPPPQYAPLIKGAATQYGVPEELLTRVLSAENGFRPTGVSSAGARGIAQFMPATAQRYGIDPDDPAQAIPGAARYLADLKAQTGSWGGALRGYLGGDPHKDASYIRNGAPQLADQLDRGGTAPAQGGNVPLEVWGDSLGVGLNVPLKTAGHVHGGDTPQTIFDTIKTQPEDHWQGKTVVLPSGSNGQQMPVVEQTIEYLKGHGANVIAVGYGPKFPEKNAELAEIAKRQGIPVVAAEGVGASEGVHPSPTGYLSMADKIRGLLPKVAQADNAGPPPSDKSPGGDYVEPPTTGETPPGTPIASAGAAPSPIAAVARTPAANAKANFDRYAPTTPPPDPAPGIAELSQMELAAAQTHARTISRLEAMASSPQWGGNDAAYEHAVREADRQLAERQRVIALQKTAITDTRNAAVSKWSSTIIHGPQADMAQQIADDPTLDGATKQSLTHFLDTRIKEVAGGDIAKYGPKFFDVLLDPAIKDPTQILQMVRPKPDGTQDITVTGADKLIGELKARNDPTKYADSKIRDGALAYARKAITIELDTGMGGKLRSPAGEDKFNIGFLPAFFYYWEKGIASGKTPAELVAKDKLDGLMAPFLPDKAERMQFTLDAGKDAAAAPIDLKSQAGIVAAYRGGKIPRDQAVKALSDIGAIDAPVPPIVPAAPAISVPLAR